MAVTREGQKALERAIKAHAAMRRAEASRRQAAVDRATAITAARAAGMTLAEIAQALQVSIERVRQMGTDNS